MSSVERIAQLESVKTRAQQEIDLLQANGNALANFLDNTPNLNEMIPKEIIASWEAFKIER